MLEDVYTMTTMNKIKKRLLHIKHTIFNEILSSGDVGFKFRKLFKNNVFFLGTISKIRLGTENNKDRRCIYSDEDSEDLSLRQIQCLSSLYHLPRFVKKLKENQS